jgi:hypothetical protein
VKHVRDTTFDPTKIAIKNTSVIKEKKVLMGKATQNRKFTYRFNHK